jgi:hypothetical protein
MRFVSDEEHGFFVQFRELANDVPRVARGRKMLCRAQGDGLDSTKNGCSSLPSSEQGAAQDMINARVAGSQELPDGSRLP